MSKSLILILTLALLPLSQSGCSSDSDCRDYNTCSGSTCKHKDFSPLAGIEIGGSFAIVLMSGLSNAGGIGGGPLMSAILIMMFYFSTEDAIPLAQVIVFGGSLVAMVLKLPNRHPTQDRPLIHYELSMLLISPLLVGTTYGVLINRVLPEWLTLALLFLLLCFITFKTQKKGRQLFNKEKLAQGQQDSLKVSMQPYDEEEMQIGRQENSIPQSTELQAIYAEEHKMFPLKNLIVILCIYFLIILCNFLGGAKGTPSLLGIQACSVGYWIFELFFALTFLVVAILTLIYLVKVTEKKQRLGYKFDPTDTIWNYKSSTKIALVALVAGLLAGMLGIGGGLVMNPVMLELGVLPEISTATSSSLVFFTSSIAVIVFASGGAIDPEYGGFLFAMAFVGSLIGVLVIKRIVTRSGRTSILVLLLAIILGLAAFIIVLYGSLRMSGNEGQTPGWGFRSFCNQVRQK